MLNPFRHGAIITTDDYVRTVLNGWRIGEIYIVVKGVSDATSFVRRDKAE